MTRAWIVTVRETLDGGNLTHANRNVEASDISAAIAKAQAAIDAQEEHAGRYEIVSATLAYETPKEKD